MFFERFNKRESKQNKEPNYLSMPLKSQKSHLEHLEMLK